jgi:uncharacterized membrane protein YeaQ/YmgE (transglycosylase-associated protein family)
MFMNLIAWLAVGLIAGLVAAKFVKHTGDDPKLGLSLGALGAAVSGFAVALFGSAGVNEFNARSLWGAAVGAAIALAVWHSVRGMAASTQRTTRKW